MDAAPKEWMPRVTRISKIGVIGDQEDVQSTNPDTPKLPTATELTTSLNVVFATPMKTSDIIALQRVLLESEGNWIQRDLGIYCEKVRKAMDLAFARITALEDEKTRLKNTQS
jgi:hypothetical protein